MQRLLIIGCSQRKRSDRRLLSAIERYDGPAFRVLRRYCRENPKTVPTVYILSAEFGLISGTHTIPHYDRPMDARRAEELRTAVGREVRKILLSRRWSAIGICLGKQYLHAIAGVQELFSEHGNVHFLAGGLGKRLSALHGWLRDGEPSI